MSSEFACVYAALILHDEGIELDATKMKTLIEAAGIEIESIWTTLFAKALAGKDIGDFLMNVGSSASAAVPAAPATAAAAKDDQPAKAKEEEKEESDDDMGFGLFD